MKMICYVFILIYIFQSVCFASLPSTNSIPLPTIESTNNKDTVLTEKVQEAIKKNKLLKNQPVSAASHSGIVTLQGSIETKIQEVSAIKTAKSIKGVVQVKSQLTIGNHGKKVR